GGAGSNQHEVNIDVLADNPAQATDEGQRARVDPHRDGRLVGQIQLSGMGYNGEVISAIKVEGTPNHSRRSRHDGAVLQRRTMPAATRIAEDRAVGLIKRPVADQT